jgi:hypothetical protein
MDDIEKPEDQIKTLLYKLERSEKMIGQMRIDFTKDIINMQDQMMLMKYTKYFGFKFIEIKYFDATDILNDDIR